ncbi:MAG: hypothetical protein IPJ77_23670 [Planctomycetes bacterium]|nr:hypothetical protein [Planctomycetota bacterium]
MNVRTAAVLLVLTVAAAAAGAALLFAHGDGAMERASRAEAPGGARAGSAELERPAASAHDVLGARTVPPSSSGAPLGADRPSVALVLTVVNDRRLAVRAARSRLLRTYGGAREEDAELHPFDGYGRLEWRVEPGEYEVVVSAPRHRTHRDRIVVPSGAPRFEHEVVLVGDGQLLATVEGPSGARPFAALPAAFVREQLSVFATRAELVARGSRSPAARDEEAAPSLRSLADAHAETHAWLTPSSAGGDDAARLVWVLAVPPERPLWVHVAFGDTVVATEIARTVDDRVRFVLDDELLAAASARLHARIVDAASGADLAGAEFELDGRTVTSDERGELELDGLPPGAAEWRLACAGHEERRGRVDLAAGERTELGTLALDAAARIEGQIVNEHGRPVDARVVLVPDTVELGVLHAGMQARGELDLDRGRFVFEHAGRRRYRVLVRDERWCAEPLHVDARAGDVGGLELRVAHGSVARVRTSGRVAALLVLDERGRIACYDELRADATLTLAPGRYTLRTELDGRVVEREFDCSGGEVVVDLAP